MNLVGVADWLAHVTRALARPARQSAVLAARGAHVVARLERGGRLNWRPFMGRWLAAGALVSLGACNLENPGTTQPEGVLTYPIALAFSSSSDTTTIGNEPAPKYLYVANTNYDVRYNGASVQAYDLEKLADRLTRNSCFQRPDVPALDGGADLDAGDDLDADLDAGDAGQLDAGMDAELDAGDAGGPAADPDAGDAAGMDAELDAGELDASDGATDAALPDGAGADTGTPIAAVDAGPRDVIPKDALRGRLCDGRRTPLDPLDAGSGDPRDETVCCFGDKDVMDEMRASEISIDSFANGMDRFAMPSGDRDFLFVSVRSRNKLLYIEADPRTGVLSCGGSGRCERGPDLDTESLADEDTKFAPQSAAVASGSFDALGIDDVDEYEGFVATAHSLGQVSLFGVTDTGRPELLDVVTATAQRAVALHIDPPTRLLYAGAVLGTTVARIGARRSPVAPNLPTPYGAPPLNIAGLSGANDVRDVLVDERPRAEDEPLRAYALIRGGQSSNFLQSVAFLTLDPRTPDGVFARGVEAVRVGLGPSKLVQATIRDRHLLFASCYDAGEIHVIDADKRQTVTVIRDVLGPFDMKIDQGRLLMYVTDFRTSSLRVVDLHGLATRSTRPPVVIATIGVPTAPGKVR